MKSCRCLILALLAACAATRTDYPLGNEMLRREAELLDEVRPLDSTEVAVAFAGAVPRLTQEMNRARGGSVAAWCVVYIGEWYLLRGRKNDSGTDLQTAREYFHRVIRTLDDGGSKVTSEQAPAIRAAAEDGLERANRTA